MEGLCRAQSSHKCLCIFTHQILLWLRYSQFRNGTVVNQAKCHRTMRYPDLFPASAALKRALPAALRETSVFHPLCRMNPLSSGNQARNWGQFLVLLPTAHVQVTLSPRRCSRTLCLPCLLRDGSAGTVPGQAPAQHPRQGARPEVEGSKRKKGVEASKQRAAHAPSSFPAHEGKAVLALSPSPRTAADGALPSPGSGARRRPQRHRPSAAIPLSAPAGAAAGDTATAGTKEGPRAPRLPARHRSAA